MALSIPQMARMSRLLEEALALDEAGRRVWLERAMQEHPDLADALREALLPGPARAAQLQELMSLPKLAAEVEASAPAPSGLAPGARVGPYQLIRPLGAGGMAEVWLARRADGAFKREVALKLPMLNRLEAGLEMRFARECDILAVSTMRESIRKGCPTCRWSMCRALRSQTGATHAGSGYPSA
jgi:eukaryotic-like serine/threonine-protein kinase